MDISVVKVKQYNSTKKNVIMVDGEPICVVAGEKNTADIIAYLNGYNRPINDGKIKKILDNVMAEKYCKNCGVANSEREKCAFCFNHSRWIPRKEK